ncbi:uncharacterized protein LOC113492012 [Trichoplusia ni]|uniref:Uncharacterized protein LOC113492012 n=1 Tax=Trichoplusia ni TaxID=7111 RepID=A0A7E5V9W7_TRINI|nr:uncharacterized protein LOC113492012 [Trichoplusia ni]
MSQVCITLAFVLVVAQYACGYPGDSAMFLPPFEMRAMGPYPSQAYPYHQVNRHKPPQVPYTDVVPKKPLQIPADKQSNQNMTFSELVDALNKIQNGTEFQRLRTSDAGERKVNTLYAPSAAEMNFASKYAPPPTYDTSPDPASTSAQPKTPLLKPDLAGVLTPKVTNKMSGLMSLLPALLASPMSGGLEKTGMKDLLINGIIKPLLISKGGIKTLISKLTIPVIGLLLINLEVLVIIWWLWEDCDIVPVEPTYPATYSKPAYNYNNNSYR